MKIVERIVDHKSQLLEASKEVPFVVFLCGPTLVETDPKPSAVLRSRLKADLEEQGFDVVLGEDDGLENTRLELGINAQDNELEFIRRHCNAVVIIADSVGAFCELGLFSWHFVHKDGVIENGTNTDFIVLVDQQYETHKSYLNEGPVDAILGFGQALYIDFASDSTDVIVKRLTSRRGVMTIDRRGRPKGTSR